MRFFFFKGLVYECIIKHFIVLMSWVITSTPVDNLFSNVAVVHIYKAVALKATYDTV